MIRRRKRFPNLNVSDFRCVDKMILKIELITYIKQVMLKATGGGGGMGLQICHNEKDIERAFAMVRNRGKQLFKNSGVLLEKYYPKSRHIEVQIFGNGSEVVHFGERECSIQRRHQKVSRLHCLFL